MIVGFLGVLAAVASFSVAEHYVADIRRLLFQLRPALREPVFWFFGALNIFVFCLGLRLFLRGLFRA